MQLTIIICFCFIDFSPQFQCIRLGLIHCEVIVSSERSESESEWRRHCGSESE